MGVVERGLLPRPVVQIANQARRWSLWTLPVGTACCSGELHAALRSPRIDAARIGSQMVDDPAAANVLVVGGPVGGRGASLAAAFERIPHPRYLMAVGACAISGGPFPLERGGRCEPVALPVDVWVPGCPPRPEAILEGLRCLQDLIGAEDLAARWHRSAMPIARSASMPARIGSLHRGAESVAERCTWEQLPAVMARIDEAGSFARSLAMVEAVEALLGADVPVRARSVRSICGKLTVLQHMAGWFAALCAMLDVPVAESISWRARELAVDLMEGLTGGRIHADVVIPGGVRSGPDDDWLEAATASAAEMWDWARTIDRLVLDVPIVARRLQGMGRLSAATALELGLAGPNLRASGVPVREGDVVVPAGPRGRRAVPESHGEGDAHARVWTRLQDARRASQGLRSLVAAAPDGPLVWPVQSVPPPGLVDLCVAHPEGSLVALVVSDGTGRPWRVHLRGPGTAARAALDHLSRTETLSPSDRALVAHSLAVSDADADR